MSTKDSFDVAVSLLGIAGAGVAFWIGLQQYWRAEQWKRAEFVAQEAKAFFENPKIALALTLVDWGGRDVRLDPVGHGDPTKVYVTRAMQSRALLPHPMAGSLGSDEEIAESAGRSGYARHQALIRDCYDALLDGLERFGGHVTSELLSPDELRPYIGYWIDDIASAASTEADAMWNYCLLAYMSYYRFDAVVALFSAFGKDVTIDGPIASGFLTKIDATRRGRDGRTDLEIAQAIRALVLADRLDRRTARD